MSTLQRRDYKLVELIDCDLRPHEAFSRNDLHLYRVSRDDRQFLLKITPTTNQAAVDRLVAEAFRYAGLESVRGITHVEKSYVVDGHHALLKEYVLGEMPRILSRSDYFDLSMTLAELHAKQVYDIGLVRQHIRMRQGHPVITTIAQLRKNPFSYVRGCAEDTKDLQILLREDSRF